MKLTLGQAAKTAKRSKGTLSKALNSGGISAEKDDKGRWQIDPSELSRWMSANPFPNSPQNQSETPGEPEASCFLPVEIVDLVPGAVQDRAVDTAAAACTLEIDIAGGHRLRITGVYDPEALARLIRGLSV